MTEHMLLFPEPEPPNPAVLQNPNKNIVRIRQVEIEQNTRKMLDTALYSFQQFNWRRYGCINIPDGSMTVVIFHFENQWYPFC